MIDPQSEKTSGYHVFLMPSGKTAEELSEMMQILANTFQGSTFAPHVTLLARISADSAGAVKETWNEEEIQSKCAKLASELSPFPMMLGEIGAEKSFFRALYLNVINPDAVSVAHVRSLELFSMKDESPYVPHLSLIYGNFPKDVTTEMIESVPISGTLSFTADCLYLYRTEGTVEEWKLVGEFPFGG